MWNTGGSRPTLQRRSVSESEADPLNSTINPRSNSRMYITPNGAESNPNILGFIDESLYTGPGTQLQSQQKEIETNTEKIVKFLHRLQININEWEASVKSKKHFSLKKLINNSLC